MYSKEMDRKRFAKWRIDLAIHEALELSRRRASHHAFQELLAIVVSRSKLLRPLPQSGYASFSHIAPILRGLLALCDHRKNWLRRDFDWNVAPGGPMRAFGSLADHLLAKLPLPPFMKKVWLEEVSEDSIRHQKLFKHLGLGNNIRGADLPILLNKRMAKFFLSAPDHLTVEQALRWSQVRGLGGDHRVAKAILSSRIGDDFAHEAFWIEVIRFLVSHASSEPEMFLPTIEYLYRHRCGISIRSFAAKGAPGFRQLINRVRHWVKRNPQLEQKTQQWPRMPIGGYEFLESNEQEWAVRYWTIRELTDTEQLVDEGKQLQHCVASYADACVERRSSIWSMKCHGALESSRVLTVEVDPRYRRIVTALGQCNRSPSPDARNVMERWADQERLSIASWV